MKDSSSSILSKEQSRLLHRYIPISRWLPTYQFSWIRPDLMGAISVWAVIVPAAMAYAGIVGVDPVVGLYSVPLALIANATL